MKGLRQLILCALLATIIPLALAQKYVKPLLTSEELDEIPDPPDDNDPGGEIDKFLGNGGHDDVQILEPYEGSGEQNEIEDKRLFANPNGLSGRWPYNIVPYEIDDEIINNTTRRDLIEQAMKEWQAVTCIRFAPSTPVMQRWVGHSQRMSITSKEAGRCWAAIGYLDPEKYNKKKNTVNLGDGCFYKRIILHEIGHALGLKHQQSRPDRDDYLIVNTSIIQESGLEEYDIPEVGTYEIPSRRVPYDYNSIMHYGKTFFVKKDENGKELGFTMKPREPCYLDVIGTVKSISFYDAKLINENYKCDTRCRKNLCTPSQIINNCHMAYTVMKGSLYRRECACHCPNNTADKCFGVGLDFPCPNSDDFKCGNGYCIRRAKKCDGVDHCGNGDDESESVCGEICPRGEFNPGLKVKDKPYNECSELFKDWPTLACTEYREKCCLTCLNSTLPCRDWSLCASLNATAMCEDIANVINNCPVLCNKIQPGQHYCIAPHSCKQDDGPIEFNDGLKSYTSCAEIYEKYPTYTCTQMRDACCKTCAEATHPCSDLSSCDSLSSDHCNFTSVQNDCPLKCGNVKHDEFKCSEPRTLIDGSININLRRNTYTTCASLFERVPTFACTTHRETCALTCAQATTPCRDRSWCSRRARRFCSYPLMQNNCPVKCEVAQQDEPVCGGE